jgi:PAS domain S-box-containing protein
MTAAMKLRSHLVALVLVALVPVLLFSGVIAVLFARQERAAVERGMQATARAVALAVERELASTISTLGALGASERLSAGDLEAFYREARAVLPTQADWQTIILFDATGQQRLNLLRPFGADLPWAGDRAVFREAMRTRSPAVSSLLVDRVAGARNATVVVPVVQDGAVRYALAATIDPKALSTMLLRQPLGSSGLACVVDRDHVIVARSRQADEFIGRRVAPELAEELERSAEGAVRGRDPQDDKTYGAFARIPLSGWTVVLAVPASVIDAPLQRSLEGLAAGAVVSIGIALLLATLFGRQIAAPIGRLARSAERIGRGERPETIASGIAEINEVGAAIEQASGVRREHDRERERAEAALRQANLVLESLVSASPLGIMILNADGTVRMWNPACERIFGWSAGEVLGRALPAVPDDRQEEFRASIAETLEGRGLRGVETRRQRKGGVPIDISLSSAALPDEAGHPAYVLSIIDDITARRRADRHRAIQYEVSRLLAEASRLDAAAPGIIEAVCSPLGWDVGVLWIARAEVGVLECAEVWTAADEFAAFVDVTRERTFAPGAGIPGRVWADAAPVWVADAATDTRFPRRAAAVHAGLHATFAFPVVLGRQVLGVVEFFSRETRGADPELLQLMGSLGSQIGQFLDRTRAEEELARLLAAEQAARASAEEATAELQRLQRITDVALAALTVDDLLRELLARVRTVVGVDTAAVFMVDRGRDRLVLRAADGIEVGAEREPIPLGAGFVGRIALGRDPGMAEDIARVEMHSAFLRARGLRSLLAAPLIVGDRVTGVIRVGALEPRRFTPGDARLLQLVADRVALAIENAHLYEAERTARSEAEAASRAKDQFVAMLAHELRNPLAPIRSATHVIGRIATDPTVRRARDIVERQVSHLAHLLDDLLDVARITRGKIELLRRPVSLETAVEEAVDATRTLIESKAHTVSVAFPDGPVAVEADPTRLVQILGNLVNNAAKYTPPRGTIHVTGRREGAWGVLAVRDNGIGIPPAMLAHVFDLFSQVDPSFSRAEGGLGVGLTLVRSLVELHGGTVTARSEGKGRGSEFVVRLPLAVLPDRDVPDAVEGPVDLEPRSILLVEDNADAAEMLRAALELGGHTVSVWGDGADGVEAAVRERPDVMLVDIGLPGLDGYEVARQVRVALGDSVMLVALTGYGQPEDRRRALDSGFDAHLVKPVDPTELADIIARHARA